MNKLFIPHDFPIPETIVFENYRLEKLSPEVAEIDYDAVMSSKERLRTVFAEKTDWPEDNMSLEDNIIDLERHESEFILRKAFAYTVLNPTRDRCIGCVYIDPTLNPHYDSEVYVWVRDSEVLLDEELYSDVQNWIRNDWPFKNIVFPGREISWKEWKKRL